MPEDGKSTSKPSLRGDVIDIFLWIFVTVGATFLGNRLAYSLRHYSGRQILPGFELPKTVLTADIVEDWLDNYHFEEYELKEQDNGYFEFHIQNIDDGEMVVQIFEQGLRVFGEYELPADKILMIMERPQDRERLKTEIEAVLTNAPGGFDYFDDEGESCGFEDMRGVRFEYRLYPDGLSQHELNNGLLSIEQAIEYVDNRVEQMADNVQANR
ncbi:hypothetical protein [Halorubrum sp. Atlit-26R]|uniref:hypothetical protein n=1 Tax=Halorubrum sp. Atlit-26R TaxID=2282128 RepID=UPI0011C38B41|nr:hypothetical protein [Halorubrum sp. Atlit-26R]